MKIYYNDDPDVRIIIIADGNGNATTMEEDGAEPSESWMDDLNPEWLTDRIHDYLKSGYLADVLADDADDLTDTEELIARYNAVPYDVTTPHSAHKPTTYVGKVKDCYMPVNMCADYCVDRATAERIYRSSTDDIAFDGMWRRATLAEIEQYGLI